MKPTGWFETLTLTLTLDCDSKGREWGRQSNICERQPLRSSTIQSTCTHFLNFFLVQ